MLSVRVQRRLGGFDLDIAFTLPAGAILAIAGPSGAGKSATLDAIAGAPGTRGRIALGETLLLDTARGIAVPPARRRIGQAHQDARLFPHLPVAANLRYGLKRAPPPHAIGQDEMIGWLGIAPLLGRRVATLSGGERQRVAIGRALLSQPRLLLLDEPFAALDPALTATVIAALRAINAEHGLTMICVTHDENEAAALADQRLRIVAGRVVDGPSAAAPPEGIVIARDEASGTMTVRFGTSDYTLPLGSAAVGERVAITRSASRG